MPLSDTFENDLMLLIFNNTNCADVGDATGLRGSSTAGSLYIALHTADPGESGTASTSEATYTDYARVAVARSGAGFTVTANAVANAAAVTFPACSGGSSTITYFSVTTASSGTSKILWRGTTNSLAVTSGITPAFAIGELDCDIT
jgi:hypothetical protein